MKVRCPVGAVGYATIDGQRHWCKVDRHNRKGIRVLYNKNDPGSCWKANDVKTVKDFVPCEGVKA